MTANATETVLMFLNGTAMRGFRDHQYLLDSVFLGDRTTAERYRFYAVRDEFPGLVDVGEGGGCIRGELYEMKLDTWRNSLLPNEPAELVPGHVVLSDGTTANVMLLDFDRVKNNDKLLEITEFGGWRAYVDFLASEATES